MPIVQKFKVQDPEPDVYPFALAEIDGRNMLLIRGRNAIQINSPRAKKLADEARKALPGHDRSGIEAWGGVYLVDEKGDMLAEAPKFKEGEGPEDGKAGYRYERRFRLTPSL